MTTPKPTPRILILGGGYVGLYTAWGIEHQRSRVRTSVTVVEPNPYMTYQPLLPEVAGGHVDPRAVTVPLVQALRHTRVIRGRVSRVSLAEHTATVATIDGGERLVHFDHVVFALGAVTRTFPTPGLLEHGFGFKTVEEAVHLRDHVLDCVAKAAETTDPHERHRLLTFVFVGGGYTGVEALGELLDLSRRAVAAQRTLAGSTVEWHLVEALDRVAPEVGPELSRWTLGQLRERGVQVHLKTQMPSCEDGVAALSTGERIPTATIVWTAGVRPNPILDQTDVPRGPKGHVDTSAQLRVLENGAPLAGVWAAGDVAQIPDLTAEKQPAYYPPNAQNAVRQAKLLAKNIVADLSGEPIAEYRHRSLGTVAEYGLGKGAGVIKGVTLRGFPAWLAHRGYHGLAMPSLDRKWRVISGWITDALAPRDLGSLPAMTDPRGAFRRAAQYAEDEAAAKSATANGTTAKTTDATTATATSATTKGE